MIYVQFLIGFVAYFVIATVSYSETIKSSPWFYPIGLFGALIANLTWLWISSLDKNASSLMIKGLWWDSMLVFVYLIVPIIFFGARFSLYQGIGVGLIVLGIALTKF